MPHNEIYIHTDRGEYIGGDTIFGNVFVSIIQPIATQALNLELKGYEKIKWVDSKTEWYEENGQQKSRTIYIDREAEHSFFKICLPLISYPGGFPVGQWSYPWQFTLPSNLPGVFRESHEGVQKWKAKIMYKAKAILEIHHGKPLKAKQHIYIHEKLDINIQPKHHVKEQTVRTLCCIPRGPARCTAYMNKNAFCAGETAYVHVLVENGSTVKISHFNTKLIRNITLKDGHGNVKHIRDIICQEKYEGTDAQSNKESDIPLPLVHKSGHYIQPSTSSKYVKCEYQVMIEMDIPWAPDLEIYSPITLYAPQNTGWYQWTPPSWVSEAQVQSVDSQFAVPEEVLQSRMNENGVFIPPPGYQPPSAPPIAPQRSASFGNEITNLI